MHHAAVMLIRIECGQRDSNSRQQDRSGAWANPAHSAANPAHFAANPAHSPPHIPTVQRDC
eukprot:1739098-Rhodomonas_salina.1